MEACQCLPSCEFILKYIPQVRPHWDEFVTLYCQGEFQDVCERRKWFVVKGDVPPPELMPSGFTVPSNLSKDETDG
ncbi:MAG: hypothetical protein C0616_08845 [Desulfuromonas sp.]|nr:MAG: hypothetical protein C0616_08845 [Desulfuromonas sp.]